MKLKEKFNALVPIEFGGMQEPLLSDCEKIADDFAISFSEWCFMKNVRFFDDTEQGMIFKIDIYKTKYTTKELLEIFKKEKGYE
jgi:hypothetical protein